jgi:hypothetical protein
MKNSKKIDEEKFYDEAVNLYHRIRRVFDDVQGPPRITLSVARGIDDNMYNDLDRLSKLNRHHKHWRDVTDAEIEHYHDCWSFMDSEALRFYLPALVCHHLYVDVFDAENVQNFSEPPWLAMLGVEYAKTDLFSIDQLDAITAYFEIIYKCINYKFEADHFYERVLLPWKQKIETEPQRSQGRRGPCRP